MLEILEEARREAPALEHVIVAPWDDEVADCPGTLEPLAGRLRASVPAHVHVGDDREAEGRRSTSRAASSSRSPARPATRPTRTPDDVVHFATDMGWIMGPWTVVGGGAMGATIVFAEGAPDWPSDRLWRLVEEERVTILGCSPTLVRALIPHGEPQADLSSLRTFVTTGEPWNPEPVPLAVRAGRRRARARSSTCSGGTEVGACFLSCSRRRADQGVLARRAGARDGDGRGRRRRAGRSSAPARSASSSAGKPFPG